MIRAVRRMTIGAADVVAPMLAAPEIIVSFFARVTGETSFGSFLRRLVFERNYLGYIAAALDVRLSGSVAGFTADYFVFPRRQIF